MASINEEFQLKVFDHNGLIFNELVVAVSAENDTGPLSFLAGHTNFISTINGSLTKEMLYAYFKNGSQKGFLLESGIVKVLDNIIEVYLVIDLNLDIKPLDK